MIRFNDPVHGRIIARAAGLYYNAECDICISNADGDELLGGVIFQGYTRASIQVHVASFRDHWLTRDLLWVVFDYPFNQLGVATIFSQISSGNPKALEFNLKIGFKIVARIDNVFPDGQCVVTSLTRDQCRWLDLKPRNLMRRYGA